MNRTVDLIIKHFKYFPVFIITLIYSDINAQETIIKFEYYERLIFLNVKVENSNDLYFLLDTGANASAIDSETADALSLPVVKEDTIEGSAGIIVTPFVKGSVVSVGNSNVENIDFGKYDLSGAFTPPGMRLHGILGTDFLKHFSVTMDFQNKELMLYRTSQKKSQRSIPIELDKGIPRVKAVINDKVETYFRYDSGSGLFETNDIYFNTATPIFQDLHKYFPELEPVTHFSASGLGGTIRLPVYHVSSIKIGDIVIENPYLIVQPEQGYFAREDAVGFFGNNLLEKYRVVTIDFIGKRLYFGD